MSLKLKSIQMDKTDQIHEFISEVSMLENSSVYGHHLPVPTHISDKFNNTDRRVVCIFNDEIKHQCALMPSSQGYYMILLQKRIREKLNVNLGDQIKVKIEKDQSEYGLPVPEELYELWAIDPDADAIFHILTKGKQRTLIHMISQGKRSETRVKKAVAILEYLKSVGGNLDFKEMMHFIKNYNAL
jgi:hypothetical protein